MRIHEAGHLIKPHIQQKQLPTATTDSNVSHSAGNSSSARVVETSSVGQLQSLLAGQTDVRETLVQEIKIKLQAGELLTKQAAHASAEAILNL